MQIPLRKANWHRCWFVTSAGSNFALRGFRSVARDSVDDAGFYPVGKGFRFADFGRVMEGALFFSFFSRGSVNRLSDIVRFGLATGIYFQLLGRSVITDRTLVPLYF